MKTPTPRRYNVLDMSFAVLIITANVTSSGTAHQYDVSVLSVSMLC